MSTAIKRRRGTTVQHSTFIGQIGEITVDTDKGAAVVHDGVTAGGFPSHVPIVENIAALRLVKKPFSGKAVYVRGYNTAGDGGGGWFDFDAASAEAEDNGMVIISDLTGTGRWLRRHDSNVIMAQWFGLAGASSATDVAAIRAALAYAGTRPGSTVHLNGELSNITLNAALSVPVGVTVDGGGGRINVDLTGAGSVGANDCFRLDSFSAIRNLTINVTAVAALGGVIRQHVSAGNYSAGTGPRHIAIENLTLIGGYDAMPMIALWADTSDVVVRNIYVPDNSKIGAVVSCEWGGDVTSGHPHDIRIENITTGKITKNAANCSVIWISGCYNVVVENLSCEENNIGVVCFAGDYTDRAPAWIQPLLGTGIVIRNMTLPKSRRQAFWVNGDSYVSGPNIDLPVLFENCCVKGVLGAYSAAFLNYCRGVTLRNCDIQAFDVGVPADVSAHEVTLDKCRITGCNSGGVWVSNTTTPPKDWVIKDCAIYGNNLGGSVNHQGAAIYIGKSERCRVINTTMGQSAGETQTAGVYIVDFSTESAPMLLNCHVAGVVGGGYAYRTDAATSWGMKHQMQGCTAAAGVSFKNGTPFSVFQPDGSRLLVGVTAAPAAGAWNDGDRAVRYPVAGQPLGWRCTVAGTPGTWVAEANL